MQGYKKMMANLMVLLMVSKYSSGGQRILKYKKLPSEATLDGIGCAIERHNTSRGVKFDPETGHCSSLSDAWFNGPKFESSKNYFKMASLENVFPQNKTKEMIFPLNFDVGCSVVLYMHIVGNSTVSTIINLENVDKTVLAMHVKIQSIADYVDITSRSGYVSGDRIYLDYNPFMTLNQTYRIKFTLTLNEIQFYTDDVLLYNFTHRYGIDQYKRVSFEGEPNAFCNRMLILYPD